MTLRYVAGLTTAQIARAFLVPEATMAKRLVRAKRKIAAAGVPIEIPDPDRLDDRLASVCGVVYAIFTEGHASAAGVALLRGELCDEALFLCDTLVALLPDNHDVLALRALCRLTDARRATRVDADGLPVLLRDQDRSRWDRPAIDAGRRDLIAAHALVPADGASPYLLLAMLAALHAAADSYDSTNWAAIISVYDSMIAADASPVLRLNRAVAVAERDGPSVGLDLLDELADEHGPVLDRYHYFHAGAGRSVGPARPHRRGPRRLLRRHRALRQRRRTCLVASEGGLAGCADVTSDGPCSPLKNSAIASDGSRWSNDRPLRPTLVR